MGLTAKSNTKLCRDKQIEPIAFLKLFVFSTHVNTGKKDGKIMSSRDIFDGHEFVYFVSGVLNYGNCGPEISHDFFIARMSYFYMFYQTTTDSWKIDTYNIYRQIVSQLYHCFFAGFSTQYTKLCACAVDIKMVCRKKSLLGTVLGKSWENENQAPCFQSTVVSHRITHGTVV